MFTGSCIKKAKVAKSSINAPYTFLKSLYLLKNFVAKTHLKKSLKGIKIMAVCLASHFRFRLLGPV